MTCKQCGQRIASTRDGICSNCRGCLEKPVRNVRDDGDGFLATAIINAAASAHDHSHDSSSDCGSSDSGGSDGGCGGGDGGGGD